MGRTELASLLGVSAARITKYIAEGMPSQSQGRGKPASFDVAACMTWLRERTGQRPDKDERARYFRLQGDKIEQEIRQRAGELVEAAEVERRWAGMVSAVRERLLSLSATMLQRGLITAEHEDALIALVDEALTELSAREGGGADVAA